MKFNHPSTLGLKWTIWSNWVCFFVRKWLWIRKKWLVVQTIRSHLYGTCIEMLTHRVEFHICLYEAWETNKGSSFTDLGFHKQDDREKDELLMFFHFTLWTFHSGNYHRAKVVGLAIIRLFLKECSFAGAYLVTVDTADAGCTGKTHFTQRPRQYQICTCCHASFQFQKAKSKGKYFRYIYTLIHLLKLTIIEVNKGNTWNNPL